MAQLLEKFGPYAYDWNKITANGWLIVGRVCHLVQPVEERRKWYQYKTRSLSRAGWIKVGYVREHVSSILDQFGRTQVRNTMSYFYRTQ